MRMGGKALQLLGTLQWCVAASYSPATARMIARHTQLPVRAHQLRRWEQKKWIIRQKDERTSEWVISLTREGRLYLQGEKDVETRVSSRWDRKWRVLTFDLPRNHGRYRRKLREWLQTNDFVGLQGSVWICPFPVEEEVRQLKSGMASALNVLVFETERLLGLEPSDIVEQAWDWDSIAARHESYRVLLRNRPGKKSPSETLNRWIKTEQEEWRHLITSEGLLPRDLQPAQYPMSRTLALRNKLLSQPG